MSQAAVTGQIDVRSLGGGQAPRISVEGDSRPEQHSRRARALYLQGVCSGVNSFEPAAAYGRATAAVKAIVQSEREKLLAGLGSILGPEATARIEAFALAAVGETIAEIDTERTVAGLSTAELADMRAITCMSPGEPTTGLPAPQR